MYGPVANPLSLDASWAALSTRDLLVELQRRQDGERPVCGGKAQGWYDMAAHVFALFLILVLSTLGEFGMTFLGYWPPCRATRFLT